MIGKKLTMFLGSVLQTFAVPIPPFRVFPFCLNNWYYFLFGCELYIFTKLHNNFRLSKFRRTEAATGSVLPLEILQNLQENTCGRASFLIQLQY